VTEHAIHRDWCPCCRKPVEPRVPDALPDCTLGNRNVVLSAWLHYGLGVTTRPGGDGLIDHSRAVAVRAAPGLRRSRRATTLIRTRRRAVPPGGLADAKAGGQEQRHAGHQHQDSNRDRQRRPPNATRRVGEVYRTPACGSIAPRYRPAARSAFAEPPSVGDSARDAAAAVAYHRWDGRANPTTPIETVRCAMSGGPFPPTTPYRYLLWDARPSQGHKVKLTAHTFYGEFNVYLAP